MLMKTLSNCHRDTHLLNQFDDVEKELKTRISIHFEELMLWVKLNY